jgi:hypothetical protein
MFGSALKVFQPERPLDYFFQIEADIIVEKKLRAGRADHICPGRRKVALVLKQAGEVVDGSPTGGDGFGSVHDSPTEPLGEGDAIPGVMAKSTVK